MLEPDLLIVEDALQDPRFAGHPLVQNEPHVRFYAGRAIRGPSGQPLGAICVMDTVARTLEETQRQILVRLTQVLEKELQAGARVAELRRKVREHFLLDAATQLPTEALFSARLARSIAKQPSNPIMIALIRLD